MRLPRTQNKVAKLSEEQKVVYESIRIWRKTAAAARDTEASLVLQRGTMLELSRVRPCPQDLAGLASSGLLEPWRIRYYGDDILRALNEPGKRRSERRGRREGKRREA